jgi:hypothetical protein
MLQIEQQLRKSYGIVPLQFFVDHTKPSSETQIPHSFHYEFKCLALELLLDNEQ